MGKLFKGLVKIGVATAAVGGLCYMFKDQIKETKVYKDYDVDDKIKKVKTVLKEKMPNIFDNEADIVEDDEIFFDDLDSDTIVRDYVPITPEKDETIIVEEVVTQVVEEVPTKEETPAKEDTEEVPTIEV